MTDKIEDVELLHIREDCTGHVISFRVLESTEPMRVGLVFEVNIANRTQAQAREKT